MNLGFATTILIGAKTTVLISISSMALGLLLAVIGAACEMSSWPLKTIAFAWHGFIRGLPDILIIFACNFGLQMLINSIWPGHALTPFVAGLIALSIIVAAYASQIVVSSYYAIPKGLSQAAKALHLPKKTTLFKVILPQFMKHALPALINLWLVVLKDSSIISLIGLNDMMNAAHIAASETFEPFTYYCFVGLIYLILSGITLKLKQWLSQSLQKGETHVVTTHA